MTWLCPFNGSMSNCQGDWSGRYSHAISMLGLPTAVPLCPITFAYCFQAARQMAQIIPIQLLLVIYPPFHPIFFLPFIALLFLPLSERTLRDQKLLQKYEIRWGPTPVRCTYGENKESAQTGCKPSCGVFSLCFLICLNSHWSGAPELCRLV